MKSPEADGDNRYTKNRSDLKWTRSCLESLRVGSGESVWEFGLAVPVLKVYWWVGGWWYGGRLSVAEG